MKVGLVVALLILVQVAAEISNSSSPPEESYFSILGYTLPETGIPDVVVVKQLYLEKIKPLFASRKIMSDPVIFRQFSRLLEAQSCLVDTICAKATHGKALDSLTEDPMPGYTNRLWEGVTRLSPYKFRTQVLDGPDDEEWLIAFVKFAEWGDVDTIRNPLLDAYHALKPKKLNLGVVECTPGEYDFCTSVGSTPALALWKKGKFFEGKLSLYQIAKFIVTYVHDVEIVNYKKEDIPATIVKLKEPLYLIDSASATQHMTYPDLKTVIALTSRFANVGIIDCMKYGRLCNLYPLPEPTPLKGFSVPPSSIEFANEDMEKYGYGLTQRNGGSKPEHLIGNIFHETASQEKIETIVASQLHKLSIKAKHGRIPPFVVFMGPAEQTVRLHSLKKNLDPSIKFYHMDCSKLELYCYRYNADEDTPKIMVFKEGGFEFITTRTNVYDRVTMIEAAVKSKLLSMRSEDLYNILQDGPMNNTLIQYFNSTWYAESGYDGMLEADFIDLREGTRLLNEVHGTTVYSVDCALYSDTCEANKVKSGTGIHYITTRKVIKDHVGFLPRADYVQFVNQCHQKDELVAEKSDPIGDQDSPENREIKEAFDKFHSEL